MKTKAFFIALLVLSAAIQAQSALTAIYVRPTGGDYDNLQDAVDAAVAAGGSQLIIVGDGIYTGPGNHDIVIDTDGLNLTIESENGRDNCIIDAQSNGRVFSISNINTADSVLIHGLTIRSGHTPDIYGGGGILNHNSVLTLEDCIITGNDSTTKGGAIYSAGTVGSLVMDGCLITENMCLASSGGGAMYLGNNTSITITDCVFSNNHVPSPYMHGGCMFVKYGNCDIKNCVFESNNANGSGGVFYAAGSSLDFTNCVFDHNVCESNGGVGFFADDVYTTTVNVKNCIFNSNTSTNLGNTFYIVASSPTDAVLNYSYSDIDDSIQNIDGTGTWNDLGGNINTDPEFLQSGYWSGGTWYPGDYHLLSMVGRWDPASESWVTDDVQSPCIDAGDPCSGVGNEPASNGGIINIGAYGGTAQASKSPYCPATLSADLNKDCRVDIADFAEMAAQWLSCDLQPQTLCW